MSDRSIPRSALASCSSKLQKWYGIQSLLAFFESMPEGYRDRNKRLYFQLQILEVRVRERLDSNSAISTTPVDEAILKECRALRKFVFESCLSKSSPLVRRYLSHLSERGRSARKEEHISRICWQLTESIAEGWYPVFVTLTVRNEDYAKVFAKNSNAFRDYYRSVERSIGRALGLSKREAEQRDIHKYFAVVERGDKNGRLHIHVLHICKALPENCWRCPNAGRVINDRREISQWRAFWRYGYVSAVAVRTSAKDVFCRLGWSWPVVREGDCWKPYRSAGVLGVSRYIGKYINKTRYHDGGFWRCRMTRNFGTKKIRNLLSRYRILNLWMIAMGRPTNLRYQTRAVPAAMIKSLAIREMMKRYPETLVRLYIDLEPALRMPERVRKTGITLTKTTKDMGDFKWLRTDLEEMSAVPRWITSGLV